MSERTAPTQGAKPPSSPTKIEFGICSLAKSLWCLTSSIITPFSFEAFSNSSAERDCLLFLRIEDKSS